MTESRKLIICRGIPGSGKSTWAKRFIKEQGSDKWIRVNNDDIRRMLGEYWVPSRENLVKEIYTHTIYTAMDLGFNIIIDNMNLNPKTIHEIEVIVKNMSDSNVMPTIGYKCSYTIEYKDFFIPLEECIERDSLRANPIGAKTIKDIYRRYRYIFTEQQIKRPILVQSYELPTAIIVDLDGTLALNTSGRPFFGKGCDEGFLMDTCVESVTNAVRRYCSDVALIIMSGREGTELGRKNTEQWLEENYLHPDMLLMRKEGDYRPDEVIKLELFDTHIRHKYYVDFVIDDRDKVVKMWRELGLLCLQPWEGKF